MSKQNDERPGKTGNFPDGKLNGNAVDRFR